MDITPNRKPKSAPRFAQNGGGNSPEDIFGPYDNSTTPIQSRNLNVYDEYSPIFMQCTQEALDNQDVVWDWNSPQSKPKQSKIKQKRLPITHSPIIPSKRPLSANHLKVSDKIRSQLEALKNQLESDVKQAKSAKQTADNKNIVDPDDLKDLEEFFNDDSIEEELIMQSQRVENLFNLELKAGACDTSVTKDQNVNKSINSDFRKVKSDNRLNDSIGATNFKTKSVSSNGLYVSPKQRHMATSTSTSRVTNVQLNMSLNDSFDFALQSIRENDFEENTKMETPKKKFGSSRSMEHVGLINSKEIERKRREALAKLQSKRQQKVVAPPATIIETNKAAPLEESPIKCSPEEIEQKRLQALAKLQAKKKQEIIEKNRKEALKRLEMNKKKRAMMMKNITS